MKAISVMVKPSSSACNMRCEYCFYHSLAEKRKSPFKGMMTESTLLSVIKNAFYYADGATVSLSFQGGEPLLSGKSFFENVASFIKEHNTKNSPIFVAVQTNGTLLDEEWCALFKREGWLVGLSLDGDDIINANRIMMDGTSSFAMVSKAADLMQKEGVAFNILTVVTANVARNIDKIYSYLIRRGFKHLQFIPVLMPSSKRLGEKGDGYAAPTTAEYINFYKKLFALYVSDMKAGRYTSIRQFDNLVRMAHGAKGDQCGMCGGCSRQFVLEGNGDVYPCDFYCDDEHFLGNINENSFEALEKTDKAVTFLQESASNNPKCHTCKWNTLCGGGCKRENMDMDRCKVFSAFLPYAYPHLKRMC